jgi:hypothetical protein
MVQLRIIEKNANFCEKKFHFLVRNCIAQPVFRRVWICVIRLGLSAWRINPAPKKGENTDGSPMQKKVMIANSLG